MARPTIASLANKKALSLGDDLLSQTLAGQVSSALTVFASVFEMRTGGTPSQRSPRLKAFSSMNLEKINCSMGKPTHGRLFPEGNNLHMYRF